jgi:hypothetical protein
VGQCISGWGLEGLPDAVPSTGDVFRRRRPGGRSMYATHVDERQFFTEKPEERPASFQCPQCRRTNEYSIRWIRRTKKSQPPSGSDERARAMFSKVKDYLVRVDEHVTCKTCRKRFEIPSHQNIVFLQDLEGLPKDDYDE